MWEKEPRDHISRQFIPDLRLRLEEVLVVSTHVTQLLAGHGDTDHTYSREGRGLGPWVQSASPEEDVFHVLWDCQNPDRVQP